MSRAKSKAQIASDALARLVEIKDHDRKRYDELMVALAALVAAVERKAVAS